MELLHHDLHAISHDLAGATIIVGGNEYVFSDFYLDAERIPPVAEGYVLHLRLWVSAWRWEKYENLRGDHKWCRKKYSFRPDEVCFVCNKILPGIPT